MGALFWRCIDDALDALGEAIEVLPDTPGNEGRRDTITTVVAELRRLQEGTSAGETDIRNREWGVP